LEVEVKRVANKRIRKKQSTDTGWFRKASKAMDTLMRPKYPYRGRLYTHNLQRNKLAYFTIVQKTLRDEGESSNAAAVRAWQLQNHSL